MFHWNTPNSYYNPGFGEWCRLELFTWKWKRWCSEEIVITLFFVFFHPVIESVWAWHFSVKTVQGSAEKKGCWVTDHISLQLVVYVQVCIWKFAFSDLIEHFSRVVASGDVLLCYARRRAVEGGGVESTYCWGAVGSHLFFSFQAFFCLTAVTDGREGEVWHTFGVSKAFWRKNRTSSWRHSLQNPSGLNSLRPLLWLHGAISFSPLRSSPLPPNESKGSMSHCSTVQLTLGTDDVALSQLKSRGVPVYDTLDNLMSLQRLTSKYMCGFE